MELKDMIFRRKSVRKYADQPVEEDTLRQILDFCSRAKPLDPGIGIRARIVTKEQVRFYFPWKAPQLLAIYSEDVPGYLENLGFVFQQVDLYLQSIGLGSCWMGLGKLRGGDDLAVLEDGLQFVILIAFGYPQEPQDRQSSEDFNRKPLSDISDRPDPRLEVARLAPSSTNSQPWYFTHEGDVIHAYCSQTGLLRHKMLGNMNRIDMGIALAHLYVANPQTFRYFTTDAPQRKGMRYTGSVVIAPGEEAIPNSI